MSNGLQGLDDNFKLFIIVTLTFICILVFIIYMVRLSRLPGKEASLMTSLYPSVDGYLVPISAGDPDCSGNLYDYYVKTAYNACSAGAYKNDYVSLDALKAVIKQGVRCLDFEIYSIDNKPVVATSTTDNYYVKETYNSVSFSSVMDVIKGYAFSGGTCPNPSDPLLIHLRCMSNNQDMYAELAKIFKANTGIMLGPEYSYESEGKNLGTVPLLSLQNKVVLIIDRSNTAFLENQDLLEYVNMTSNSVFMREYDYSGVKNNPDINELTEFNKQGMTFVTPDGGANPANPSGIVCRGSGCQMVAMRYQLVDNNLLENTQFFDSGTYAFVLRPAELRYQPVNVPAPTPQNPNYSYATRNVTTNYYSYNF